MILTTIAFFFATLHTTVAGPPRHDKYAAQHERDVVEFARLLAKNDIADLPAHFSFWHSSGSLMFREIQASRRHTFRVATVIYSRPRGGDRSHSFIFANDSRCVLHTEESGGFTYSGFVDLTGDGQMEKVATFFIYGDREGDAKSDIGKSRLRAWSFANDTPTLILDAVFSNWAPVEGDISLSVRLVPPDGTAPWSISLETDSGKAYGRFYWSKEKRAIVHDGLDEKRCRMRKLDRPTVGKCPMHPDMEITREKGCPICGMRLPD